METLINNTPCGYSVGILQDEELLRGIDSLLRTSNDPVNTIQTRLHHLGLIPQGDIPTIIYGWGLYTYFYNQQRDSFPEDTIEETLKLSYSRLLQNKIINNYLASKVSQTIDKAAGV
jgi:hypothetical protein